MNDPNQTLAEPGGESGPAFSAASTPTHIGRYRIERFLGQGASRELGVLMARPHLSLHDLSPSLRMDGKSGILIRMLSYIGEFTIGCTPRRGRIQGELEVTARDRPEPDAPARALAGASGSAAADPCKEHRHGPYDLPGRRGAVRV